MLPALTIVHKINEGMRLIYKIYIKGKIQNFIKFCKLGIKVASQQCLVSTIKLYLTCNEINFFLLQQEMDNFVHRSGVFAFVIKSNKVNNLYVIFLFWFIKVDYRGATAPKKVLTLLVLCRRSPPPNGSTKFKSKLLFTVLWTFYR